MAQSALIKSVAVVGTGTIGASWSALFLSRGLKVVASDPANGAEGRLRDYVRKAWPTIVALDSNAVTGSLEDAEKRLVFDVRLEDHLQSVDFVQENGPEKIEYKKQMFGWLDQRCRPGVVLASSSSGLAASRYAMGEAEPAKDSSQDSSLGGTRTLVGHPFNPPHLIPLVEIVPHPRTSQEAVSTAQSFYRDMGRTPVVLRKESPGFVANRLQAALVHEAYSLVSRGLVSSADVDAIVSNSLALRWALHGPFLTKVLGGGGGAEGFKHHLAHVGKAAQEWAKDMAANAYVPTEETNGKLAKEVDEQLAGLGNGGVEKLPSERDEFLVGLLKLKQQLAASARV